MRERQCVREALRKRGMSHGREKEVRAMKRVRGGKRQETVPETHSRKHSELVELPI